MALRWTAWPDPLHSGFHVRQMLCNRSICTFVQPTKTQRNPRWISHRVLWKMDNQTYCLSSLRCITVPNCFLNALICYVSYCILMLIKWQDTSYNSSLSQTCVNKHTVLACCWMANHCSMSVTARHDPLSPLCEHLHNTSISPHTDALWESRRGYNTVRIYPQIK